MIGRRAFLDRVVGRIFHPLSRNDPHILFRGDPALVIMDHLVDGVGLKTLGYLDLRLLEAWAAQYIAVVSSAIFFCEFISSDLYTIHTHIFIPPCFEKIPKVLVLFHVLIVALVLLNLLLSKFLKLRDLVRQVLPLLAQPLEIIGLVLLEQHGFGLVGGI